MDYLEHLKREVRAARAKEIEGEKESARAQEGESVWRVCEEEGGSWGGGRGEESQSHPHPHTHTHAERGG